MFKCVFGYEVLLKSSFYNLFPRATLDYTIKIDFYYTL